MKQYLSDYILYMYQSTCICTLLFSELLTIHTAQTLSSGFINTLIKSMGFLFVSQNPVEAPKRDYSVLPLLAAPPQVGERIAFKVKNL